MKIFMGHILLFLLLHLFQTSVSQIQFTSSYEGKTLTGLVGSSVNFTWSFSGGSHGVRAVNWGLKGTGDGFSNNGILVTVDPSGSNPVVINNARASVIVSGDQFSGQVTFTLRSIKTDDEKLYGCKITPVRKFGNADFRSVQLVVKGPPKIKAISHNQTVIDGGKIKLNCSADGNPVPNITWTRVSDNSVVTFPLTIRRQDEGAYRCTADNGIDIVSSDVFIVVQYKPKGATIIINPPQNPALQGQDVTITCRVTEAKPPVSEFKFYFNDTLKTAINVNHFTMTNVQRLQHYGKYKCVARNDVGEGQSDEVFLNINVPAEIISLTPNVTVNETNPIDLKCDASGHPAPVIKWTKDGGPEQSTGSNHYRIDSSKTSDSGAYVCIAENVVRRAEMKTFVTVYYAPTVKDATPLTTQSWIGQTVTLKCEAEGVPTPTITWKKPSGMEVKKVTALENTANVVLNNDQDFGQYTCEVTNGVGNAATKIVQVQQIKAPDSPSITVTIQAITITVRWTEPANGGSPITAYRVVVLQGSTEIRNMNVTSSTKEKVIDSLNKSTNYTVKVFARNFVFEGNATEKKIQTKFEGAPGAAEITDLPAETNEVRITLTWKAAQDNGAPITKYTVYRRTINEDGTAQEWIEINEVNEVKDPSDRKVNVTLQKGKTFEFVVTATNRFGEGEKEERMRKKVTVLGDVSSTVVSTYVPGGTDPDAGADTQSGGMNTPIIAGAAAVGVLLIIGLIIFAVWWKRRKTPRDGASLSGTALRDGNEIEDGYQDVSPAAAAQGLQASGPVAEPNYAEVNVSQKKKNRRPVIDEYAQVDRSKKTKKKPKKQPGELDYAELDDLRPRPQPAPVPSGANARPVVRPPAYEGTLYADIAQFGVPQPEPTYDNMPRKDVVYSNVESM